MSEDNKIIKLKGRIFLTFNIETLSGLFIGGSDEGIGIGGVDKAVIRNKLDNRPYVPGSSLRGKIRSLTEKYEGAVQNKKVGKIRIHECNKIESYVDCDICHIYGVSANKIDFATPTRLIVRDVQLDQDSAEALIKLRTDLPYTESKAEVAIDRVTSAASPRQMERVPAGAVFGPAEMVYSLYDDNGTDLDSTKDLDRFKTVITGLQLLEDDYLGGLGSRGSGKVKLSNIKVEVKSRGNYDTRQLVHKYSNLDDLVTDFNNLKAQIKEIISESQ